VADRSAAVERLILWDLDGTLARTGGVGAEAFGTAIERLFGVPAAGHGVTLAGKTDPQIAREILTALDLHDADGDAEARLPVVLAETERLVAAGRDRIREKGCVLPGVLDLLEALRRPGIVQTLLTGNTAANAAVKLAAFDLQHWLDVDVGAYGSDNHDRNALVDVAVERVRRRHGPVDRRHAWVIGDTPLDAACARAGGVRCLLVASGFAARAALDVAGADHVVDDLTDTRAVLSILGVTGP
jgi:phosphoglycolate phosphatase-like HAD superfamily hydrolase